MPQLASMGHCRLCGATLAKAAASRHVAACSKSQMKTPPVKGPKRIPKPFLHVTLEGSFDSRYWLNLAVPVEVTLSDLDAVLRDLWLECCGHMSSFKIAGKYFNESPWGGGDSVEEAAHMGVAIREVLGNGDRFEYEYDFGSSIWLKGRVLADLDAVFPTRAIRLLARNDPPNIACVHCANAATRICTQCVWNGSGAFCDACAKSHKCGEEMLLPVINSPRMGVCAYCGPSREP